LKNSVSNPASYAQTDEYFKGWAFLNHISLLYYYGLLNRIREKKLNEKYSVDDVLKLTKNIFIHRNLNFYVNLIELLFHEQSNSP